MNPLISCLAAVMAWGLAMLAPPAAMGSLGGADVTVSEGNTCYVAGETNTFCFLITHDPSADEEIIAVDLHFPDGWTGFYTCDANPNHPPGVFALRLGAQKVRA